MSDTDRVRAFLPYLRRYARALTGSQSSGDAFVQELLEAALADQEMLTQIGESRTALYAAFSRIWASGQPTTAIDDVGIGENEHAAAERLSHIPLIQRQVILLTALEEFTTDEVAEILGISIEEARNMAFDAAAKINRETRADVLIIEDEPLISMQLQRLVDDLGHKVVGVAKSHEEALERFEQNPAGLILADICLGDGSSGIDAVDDLLEFGEIPVIYIAADPERLLTGDCPEPTYLIAKPFQEDAVRTAISQALFFGSAKSRE